MPETSILLVGATDRSEFRRARSAIDALGRVVCVRDTKSAVAAVGSGQVVPDVIVVVQSYPARFSHQEIDRLRRQAPLARVIGLMGSWCEGEARTGKPWPAAIRIYWHQWPERSAAELGRLRRGECSAWGLPLTATEEERLLLEADGRGTPRQGLIAIYTPVGEMEEYLAAACHNRGYSTVWLRPPRFAHVQGATAAVFDGSDCCGEELARLRQLSETLHPAPVVAMLAFPRIEQHDRALAVGAAAVVSKPFRLEDLFRTLDRVAGQAGGLRKSSGPEVS